MRLNINWFSPIFPAQTDISHYTNRILIDLAGMADVTIWTDQKKWDPSVEEIAKVKTYQVDNMPWSELNKADSNIYNIGNNPLFHKSIWQVSSLQPGIVILHDFSLQHFFAGILKDDWNNRQDYLSIMEEHYGNTGRIDAERFWSGNLDTNFMAVNYPLTRLALRNASGVMVHNETTYETLIKDDKWPVCYFPLPYPSSNHEKSSSSVRVFKKPYKITIFGYLGQNRRLDSFLRAFSAFSGRDEFVVNIYGKLWDERYVGKLCKELSIKHLVNIKGFVKEEELDNALSKSHLAVNLRYPTMGEASGSQLRIWDHTLPSMVTETGWYSTLPKESVAFIRPEYENEDIKTQLSHFLENPEMFLRMGIEGKRVLEKYHSPKAFSDVLINFINTVIRFRKKSVAYTLSSKVGLQAAHWLDEHSNIAEMRNTAEAIYDLTKE
jgi:glycosyltransferase involved in cell wall biosynthesis